MKIGDAFKPPQKPVDQPREADYRWTMGPKGPTVVYRDGPPLPEIDCAICGCATILRQWPNGDYTYSHVDHYDKERQTWVYCKAAVSLPK